MSDTLIYKGKEYKTISQLADDLDLNVYILAKRLTEYPTVEEAIKNSKIVVGNTEFKTKTEIANQTGIKRLTLESRLRSGYTIEEAIKQGVNTYHLLYKGKKYNSIKHLAKTLDIDEYFLRNKLHEGLYLEEAVDHILQYNSQFTAFGKNYRTLTDIATTYGISYQSLYKKFTDNETLELVILGIMSKEPIVFEKKEYTSFSKLCAEYGLSPNVGLYRIKAGWSLEDTLFTPIKETKTGTKTIYNGKSYNSYKELAEDYGFSYNLIKGVTKRTNKDFVTTLSIVREFMYTYKGQRPQLMVNFPTIIYNNIWYESWEHFYTDIGTTYLKVREYTKYYKCANYIDALHKMMNDYKPMWQDRETGMIAPLKDIAKQRGMALKTVKNSNLAEQIQIKRFPTLQFNPTTLCYTPLEDFKLFLLRGISQSKVV